MATMGFSLLMTLLAFICQMIAVFLPGWTKLNSGNDEIQLGVWYKCVNWTKCETTIKDLTNTKPGIALDTCKSLSSKSLILNFDACNDIRKKLTKRHYYPPFRTQCDKVAETVTVYISSISVLKNYLRAVVRENQGFFLKFGKSHLTDFDETLHI